MPREVQAMERPPLQGISTISGLTQNPDTTSSPVLSFAMAQSRQTAGVNHGKGTTDPQTLTPGVTSLQQWSYAVAATAPPLAMEAACIDKLIKERMEVMMPVSGTKLDSMVEFIVDKKITKALQRGDDDQIWRTLGPKIEGWVDAFLVEGINDPLSPISALVHSRVNDKFLEGKITLIAERHLERSLGPGLAILQETATRQEALSFSTSIKAITVTHIDAVMTRVINDRICEVVTPLFSQQAKDKVSTWQPNSKKVATAVDSAAVSRVDTMIRDAVEHCLLDKKNMSSPL